MREALFIKRNKDRWEKIQKKENADADETASNFIQLVDDLAYAKTFYPGSRITAYINALASKIYLGIYQNRKEESNRLFTFWKYDLPLTIRKHHGILLFAFLVFCLFFSVGFFSAGTDESFIRQMLTDGYVDMTEQNIESGNPFGVYHYGNSFLMWIGIMINNIIVSLKYFVKGIVFGVLSIYSLIVESIRLGAFEYLFYKHGLGGRAVITVLIHGLLELTAIIVACAAGVVMGKSILFPGTIHRIDSLRQGTKDGVKIIVGLMPVFALAAFFEGFVTRYANLSLVLSTGLLTISASFVVWYFIVYPIRLQRRLAVKSEGV